jgi:hypothetical protein
LFCIILYCIVRTEQYFALLQQAGGAGLDAPGWEQLRARGVRVQPVQCSRMSDILLGKTPLLPPPAVTHVDIW